MRNLRASVSPWLVEATVAPHPFLDRCFHDSWLGPLPGPPFELPLGLRDEHRQSVKREAPRLASLAQQRRLAIAVGQVVHERAGERPARERRFGWRVRPAKRCAVDQQIPGAVRQRPRSGFA